jgi:hypothetical protein
MRLILMIQNLECFDHPPPPFTRTIRAGGWKDGHQWSSPVVLLAFGSAASQHWQQNSHRLTHRPLLVLPLVNIIERVFIHRSPSPSSTVGLAVGLRFSNVCFNDGFLGRIITKTILLPRVRKRIMRDLPGGFPQVTAMVAVSGLQ